MKKTIVYLKFCFQRALGYVAIFQSFGMLYLVLGRMIDKGVLPLKSEKYLFAIAGVALVVLIFAGYLEDRCGMAREEYELQRKRMGL